VFVTAFKVFSAVAQQQRAGRHHRLAAVRVILERSIYDDRNGPAAVLLLVGPILRPGGANYIAGLPSVATCQDLCSNFPQVRSLVLRL
jgi:hypothetical protein